MIARDLNLENMPPSLWKRVPQAQTATEVDGTQLLQPMYITSMRVIFWWRLRHVHIAVRVMYRWSTCAIKCTAVGMRLMGLVD